MFQTRSSSSAKLSRHSAGNRRYRTLAPNSHVDETLFGSSRHVSMQRDQEETINGWSRSLSAPVCKKPGAETIRIITKDSIRDIRVPNQDPERQSVVLSLAEFRRIQEKSHILSEEEKNAAWQAQRQANEEVINAAEQRKEYMRQIDLTQQKNKSLSDLEIEAKERAQYLLRRAKNLNTEQEDEVKRLNEMINQMQCHAIRDTQIEEKQQNLKHRQEEEKRLNAMMEVQRLRDLEAQEHKEKLHKWKKIEGKMQIIDQIQTRQEEAMLEEELRDQEGHQLLERMEKMQMEEIKAIEKKKNDQKELLRDCQKINQQNLQAREFKKEQERLHDVRAAEFTSKKMKREAEFEAEQNRIKREKERDVARLRALQERDRDFKSSQDALRAQRNLEDTIKEWRRKEKEEAQKKKVEASKLLAARLEQIAQKERFQSFEVGRDRAEFERVRRAQQEQIEMEEEKEKERLKKIHQHAEAVRQQVRDKEMRTVTERRERYREREQMEEEARNRTARLVEAKEKKMRELKDAGLSDKYINQVQFKVRRFPKL